MQFAQKFDVFVCDYLVSIKICQAYVYANCIRIQQQHTHNKFWDFKTLIHVQHDVIPMKWVTNPLDLNLNGRKYLCFESAPNHNIQAIHSHTVTKMSSPITKKVYATIIDWIKIVAIGELFTIVVAKTKM
jgi:hypothetical protein